MKATYTQVTKLWPEWRPTDIARFSCDVLNNIGLEAGYGSVDLAVMAVDYALRYTEWLDAAARWHLCRKLRDSQTLQEHLLDIEMNREVKGFLLSFYDHQWASWSGRDRLIDLRDFNEVARLPQPHIWCSSLGITPLYMRLQAKLERINKIGDLATALDA